MLPIAAVKENVEEVSEMKKEMKDIFDGGETTMYVKKQEEESVLPEPRSGGRIEIKFTPRVFPTPSRESQDEKEKEVYTHFLFIIKAFSILF